MAPIDKKGSESAPQTPARARSSDRRGLTRHHTYHLTEDQGRRIKRLALELQLEEVEGLETINESELIRAAVEMLLDLQRPALTAVLRDNRVREQRGKYGSGWPRPGQRKKRP